ncbi:hypothetical protein CICLE_v10010031mg [Citrus x clementina]|uniref:Uncharacterized protein n=1 Tax=Citrus clementina TaxID=85681 RepID=V4WE12_CITCL|nr:hypothetical protein CICLE_v10010031mg [Citrus x clementina]
MHQSLTLSYTKPRMDKPTHPNLNFIYRWLILPICHYRSFHFSLASQPASQPTHLLALLSLFFFYFEMTFFFRNNSLIFCNFMVALLIITVLDY